MHTRNTYNPLAVALLFLAGAVFYLSNGYTEMMGSDMWWHIAAGRELIQTGTLWMVDDWSYTAFGKDWLNHEWLSDIFYYQWVSLWGVESLVYWKWLVIIATFAILQLTLARYSGDHIAALICSGMAIALAAPFLDVRPHLYTLLNFSILLWLLLGRQPRIWALALLFLIWVNLHGGFFFGLMAAGILVFPWRNFNVTTLRAAVVVGLACLAAAALNPSGIGTFLYPLKYAFDDTSPFRQLGEWLSPFKDVGIRAPLFFIFMWVPLLGLGYFIPRVRKSVDLPLEGILLTVLTLAMALTSRRFIPLFGISLAVMLAPLVAYAFNSISLRRYALPLSLVALVFAISRTAPYPLKAGPAFHYLVAEYSYPVEVLNFIEKNNIKGKVFALYNWGGYIHWRVDGQVKVFMDGRADTIYDAQTYNNYTHVLRQKPGWIAKVEDSGAQFMLWPQLGKGGQEKLQRLLATGRWRPLYRDSVSWLLARNTVTTPANMRSTPPSPYKDAAASQISAWNGKPDVAATYSEKVREVIPWHLGACNLLAEIYAERGEKERADALSQDCRSYFPSRYLR